jgi:hypothetical protein
MIRNIACVLMIAAGSAAAQNVLVWSTGNSGGDTAGVASWLQASGEFDSVTGIDQTNMSLADLLDYERVLFFTNSSGGSDPANGDVLADYADTGRRLVIAGFSWADQGGNTLGGRLIDDGLSPFESVGGSLYSNATLDTMDESFFFTGVDSVTGYFRDNVALTSHATLHGTWSDGVPAVAEKGNVAGINLFPDDSYGSVSGDHRQLFTNALAVPAPASTALFVLGGLFAASRRR